MDKVFLMKTNPVADKKCIIQGEKYRFTVLTERMIRMEYDENGVFVDRATQMAINRNFSVPQFDVVDNENQLEIITDYFHLTYDKKEFSQTGLAIQMKRNPYLMKLGTWFYGDVDFIKTGNLSGTTSTLDNAHGDMYHKLNVIDDSKVMGEPDKKVPMCDGILSKSGFTVIDDSKSMVLSEDGWVYPAMDNHIDQYFMTYGRDYLGCLKDFYHLSGKTPLLPRFTLGNWWSRYYSYTQDEYLSLMDRFEEEKLPIAVSVLDMGWHLVDIDPKYGKGWTGYSWDRKLFPDPKAMMEELHQRGKHISLNVHPADGVRAHEEMYVDLAKELGIDYEKEHPIPFNITNQKFVEAYFKYLHHPNEDDGVDFWWIDWQQGSITRTPGYDPLWMLNHFHFLDSKRKGKRPLTFSRYADLGSHRYPIGFSGSTFITWESLEFQPYFTATASNVGYGWWSHDIGGHRNGYRDDELTTRWVQFGVFSPIMRLHSSNEVFTGKEPWKFCTDSRRVMSDFMRLRHKLVPYLYTMNARFHYDDLPLIQPMYYQYPNKEEAYHVPNEYFFGSEMIVNPITSKNDPELQVGKVKTWLPEGLWFDFFTGVAYKGGRVMNMHRAIDNIPVLAKAGAIVPMQDENEISIRTDNPKSLELCVFAGKSGEFVLYEDDGATLDFEDGKAVKTKYAFNWDAEKSFAIYPAEGELSLIPESRSYTIRFYGLSQGDIVSVTAGDQEIIYTEQLIAEKNILEVCFENVSVKEKIEIKLAEQATVAKNRILDLAYEVINRAQIAFAMKEKLYKLIQGNDPIECLLSTVRMMPMSEGMKQLMEEILLANI